MLVSEFLTNLKRRGQYQAAQTVLSDADYVAMAVDQLKMVIVPKILSLRDNYFDTIKEYTLTSSRRYRLPPRCVGGRVSLVQVVNGPEITQLIQVPNTDKPSSYVTGYYISQGDLIIVGTIPTGTLMVTYPCRPPAMSATATTLTTVSAASGNVVTIAVGQSSATYQFIRSSGAYRTISPNAILGGFGPTTVIDNDCTDGTRYQVGDFLIVNNSTPYVPLEQELTDWLLQRTHMRVLQALGQTDELQAAGAKLADIERNAYDILSPRVANTPKVVFGMESAGWIYR